MNHRIDTETHWQRAREPLENHSVDIWRLPETESPVRETVKEILEKYIDTPSRIQVKEDSYGKPYSPELTRSDIYFNYSTSNTMILLAVSKNRFTGIDLEYLYNSLELEPLIAIALTESETETLSLFSSKLVGVLTYWTRKEAILKAKGIGHTVSLKTINTPITDVSEKSIYHKEGWFLKTLTPAYGYIGSLAVKTDKKPKINFCKI